MKKSHIQEGNPFQDMAYFISFYSHEATSQVDMLACTFGDCCEVFDFSSASYQSLYKNRTYL